MLFPSSWCDVVHLACIYTRYIWNKWLVWWKPILVFWTQLVGLGRQRANTDNRLLIAAERHWFGTVLQLHGSYPNWLISQVKNTLGLKAQEIASRNDLTKTYLPNDYSLKFELALQISLIIYPLLSLLRSSSGFPLRLLWPPFPFSSLPSRPPAQYGISTSEPTYLFTSWNNSLLSAIELSIHYFPQWHWPGSWMVIW